MNNILTQNDGNNQLGIGSNNINLVGIIGNTLDITQGTTSFMSISNSSGSEKISVKKPTTLANNLLTLKDAAKIEGASTNSLFYIGDNNELKTLGIGTTDEYLRMGYNRPTWGPKTFVESNVSGIGSIGYLEELKIDDDKLIGIGTKLGVKDSSISNIIKYDTNNDISLIMSNGVGIGTLTIKTKYDTNFFDITLKKVDSDFSSNPTSKLLEIVDSKTYKYTIGDLSNNSIHYYNLTINDINSFTTSTKKFHHITLRRDNQSPLINSMSPSDGSMISANDSNIQFVFSEGITAGIGNIKIEPASDSGLSNTLIDITSGSPLITFSQTNVPNDTLTINPSSNFSNLGIQYTISMVPEVGVIKDLAGNNFNWGAISGFPYNLISKDEINPQMTISSSTVNSGIVSNNTSISLTFTSTEATTNFVETDITKNNGSINNFQAVSSTVYTATFTPSGNGACTIDVNAGAYTDSQGNNNTTAVQFVWTFDNISPTMTISSTTSGVNDGSTTNDDFIELTFTSSEATTNFDAGDIDVNNGSISNFSGSGTTYTARFTPSGTGARTVVCTIDVAGGAFTDAAGNNNTAASQFNWTFDNILPGMTITSTTSGVTDGTTTNNTSISLTFTSTEATTNFASGDITVSNCSISNFQAVSSTVYTATFTPSSNGACTIDVVSNKFTDAASNNNTAAVQFNWTFDGTGPTMTITGVSSGSTSSSTPVSLTFTSSESTTNFTSGDITVSNGSLSSFSGSGTTYTASFTPTTGGTCTITVNTGVYTDSVGNNNTADSLSWTFLPPITGNTSVDWTLVNTSSANPTSSSSSYTDSNYNDGATWIIGGYQGSGKSPWHDWFDEDATSGSVYNDTTYSSSVNENRKSWHLFEHTTTAPENGYFSLSRVYERTGLDHYSGGSTNDPSHGLKIRFNTTVGEESTVAGGHYAAYNQPWGIFCKYGFTPSSGSNQNTLATKNGITGNPSRIIIDFNKYIALTAFEYPTYQYYGYNTTTHIYYWNESLSTPAWTKIIEFYSDFWGHGSVYFRKDNTGSNQGGTTNYTANSGFNNGKNSSGGYSGLFNQNIPREPIIRLRFPTSYYNGSYVKSFVRQVKYARYYKIEETGSNHESSGAPYYAKIKGIIPSQTALF